MLEALDDTPVILINGARQTGKSTLAKQITEDAYPARYLTFDDATILAAAHADPEGFIRSLDGPVVIDEVQRAPGLFRAIKAEVDRNRRPGRFLLTGSADVLLLPDLSDSLAGRMEVLTLWPFSQGELEGRKDRFVDTLFADELPRFVPPPDEPDQNSDISERILRGGFPEIVTRSSAKRRGAWFNAYITTILQRDVRDLANIERLTQMPRLLRLLATRSMALLNYSEVSRSSGLPQTTLQRYMTLLEMTFLVQLLPPWHANIGKRLVKSPKVMLADTGLGAHLVGLMGGDSLTGAHLYGALLENFIAMELRKQTTWSGRRPALHHFRLHTGQEIDLVLEDAKEILVGVEVKASTSVSTGDFNGLRALRDARSDTFQRGVVLYGGDEVVGFEPDLHAIPLQALWRW